MSETVVVACEDAVSTITLNRPSSLNALDDEMSHALKTSLSEVAEDAQVRCVVLNGAGRNFMAGGDIKMFGALLELSERERVETINALIENIHDCIEILHRMRQPVLASVEGGCAGFGLSLMASCDLAIAAKTTAFTLAYIRLGTSPDGGSTWALTRAIGVRRTLEIALLGRRFSAAEAHHYGLVNQVVEDDSLAAETRHLARRLASGPVAAIARTKRLVRDAQDASITEQLAREQAAFVEGLRTGEFAEGVRAFLEKRDPNFE